MVQNRRHFLTSMSLAIATGLTGLSPSVADADLGFSYECALMTLKDARYGLWREYDPEDTVRFFSLRLNEIGMIKKTPEEVISGNTDWRFLKEVKRELKT
jgi:NitT/TauT family transport system substrate-binding protein